MYQCHYSIFGRNNASFVFAHVHMCGLERKDGISFHSTAMQIINSTWQTGMLMRFVFWYPLVYSCIRVVVLLFIHWLAVALQMINVQHTAYSVQCTHIRTHHLQHLNNRSIPNRILKQCVFFEDSYGCRVSSLQQTSLLCMHYKLNAW